MQIHGTARRGAIFVAAIALAAATVFPAIPAFAQRNVTVPSGTRIDVRVDTAVESGSARPGNEFRATVTAPVVVGGLEVVPNGSVVIGRVADVVANRSFGQASGVVLRIERIRSTTGQEVPMFADLADANGNPFDTIDNLARGTRLQVVVNRSFTIDDSFWGGGGPGGPGGPGDDVFDSPATISQAQTVLRDLGYYNGRIDGQLNVVTRSSIGMFQRDQRIRQTGFLDRETLERLGLISETGSEVSTVRVLSADASIATGNQLRLRIVTQGATGLRLFEDHFRQRDTLHVYVRGFRITTGAPGTAELNVVLRSDEWQGLNRIVVHGAGNDIVITNNEIGQGGALTPAEAAALESQVSTLLEAYARALGMRYNRFTGQLSFGPTNYRENETELLFALNSLASTARLYTVLLRTSNDQQAIAGATDIFVQQANAVDRALNRTKSGRALVVASGWRELRDDFARMAEGSSNRFGDTPGYR
jgi:peptidoglycan hydrolase-like protein with peptidoglycan-binding domain